MLAQPCRHQSSRNHNSLKFSELCVRNFLVAPKQAQHPLLRYVFQHPCRHYLEETFGERLQCCVATLPQERCATLAHVTSPVLGTHLHLCTTRFQFIPSAREVEPTKLLLAHFMSDTPQITGKHVIQAREVSQHRVLTFCGVWPLQLARPMRSIPDVSPLGDSSSRLRRVLGRCGSVKAPKSPSAETAIHDAPLVERIRHEAASPAVQITGQNWNTIEGQSVRLVGFEEATHA
mmetsp:Transcript_46269/g.122767  ORF Transcript_46269/g.122767 Transcript_46269/m.122767 type:complete len:233 (+) Transcript_46269:559-1257(+)